MAATHSTLHFGSGNSLKVVETIAAITATPPPEPVIWPIGVTVTDANGHKLWVSLTGVEWIEPS